MKFPSATIRVRVRRGGDSGTGSPGSELGERERGGLPLEEECVESGEEERGERSADCREGW